MISFKEFINEQVISEDVLSKSDFEVFYNAYVECALWSSIITSGKYEGQAMDSKYEIKNLHRDCKKEVIADCKKFLELAQDALSTPIDDMDLSQMGHDFWLTQAGHGSNFRDNPKSYGGADNALTLYKIVKNNFKHKDCLDNGKNFVIE